MPEGAVRNTWGTPPATERRNDKNDIIFQKLGVRHNPPTQACTHGFALLRPLPVHLGVLSSLLAPRVAYKIIRVGKHSHPPHTSNPFP